jgi:NhaA family Na+:H+ antiporter
MGLAVPLTAGGERPLERMEHTLHPWVAFLIVPIFAFANAGVSLAGYLVLRTMSQKVLA